RMQLAGLVMSFVQVVVANLVATGPVAAILTATSPHGLGFPPVVPQSNLTSRSAFSGNAPLSAVEVPPEQVVASTVPLDAVTAAAMWADGGRGRANAGGPQPPGATTWTPSFGCSRCAAPPIST